MRRLMQLTLSLWLVTMSTGYAMTVAEAQVCAEKLLSSYNQKIYPRKLLAVESIIATAYGGAYRAFSPTEIELAHTVAEEHIKKSFTESSGQYKYWDLTVRTVKQHKSGWRVEGMVSVISPQGSGRYSFLALVKAEGCRVYQVRVADIMTLIDQLKRALAGDIRVAKIYKS